MDECTQKFGRQWTRRDGYSLCFLLIFAFLLGFHTIHTTVVVTNDSATYVKRAMEFEQSVADGKVYTRHFGYSFLIYAAHGVLSTFLPADSVYTWIYAGQWVSLLSRLVTIFLIYILFRQIGGTRKTFLTLLVLICLPEPAIYGADLVREWPSLMFLSIGMYILYVSIRSLRIPGYFAVGVVAGLGYLIRPECFQLVLYAVVWLILLRIYHEKMGKTGRMTLLVLAVSLGFGIVYVPYSYYSGRYIPHKVQDLFLDSEAASAERANVENKPDVWITARSANPTLWQGTLKIIEGVSENLAYIFSLPFFLGVIVKLKNFKKLILTPYCLSVQVLFLYGLLLLFLWRHYGYISRRYSVPIVVAGAGYIYPGLCLLVRKIQKIPGRGGNLRIFRNRTILAVILTAGLLVCAGKYLEKTPLRESKVGYRLTGDWIREHTPPAAVVAVPDNLLGMYTERPYIVAGQDAIPRKARYLVEIGEAGIVNDRIRGDKKVRSVYQTEYQEGSGGKWIVVFQVLGRSPEKL